MKLVKRWGTLALAAVTAAGMMSGCTTLEQKTEAETVAATFGKEEIMMDYVMLQMRTAQYSYENMFSAWYGTTDFWTQDYGDGRTVEEYVIDNVMQTIRQTKVLCDYAENNGITLSEEQEQKVEDAIATALEADEEYKEIVGMTEELVRQIYTENALANAAYLKIVEDVDTTVGDDEFIRKDMAYVRLAPTDLEEMTAAETTEAESESDEEVSEAVLESSEEESEEAGSEENETAESETTEEETTEVETTEETTETETDEAESEEEATEADSTAEETTEAEETLSAEEQAQKDAMQEAAEEIRQRLEDGEAAADFITDYNEDTTYFTATQSTSTVGEESSYVYTAEAFALSTGETLIYTDESSGAIYIILCTNDNDEEARQTAIDSEIESRKATLFAEKYADIQTDSPKFTADQDVIGTINFNTALYVLETVAETEIETEEESEAETEEEESVSEAETEEETVEEESEEETTEEAEETTADK